MVSLKRNKKEAKKSLRETMPQPMAEETYPYELKITLNKEELKKLDMALKDYDIGDKLSAIVKMDVSSMHSSDTMFGDSSESMCLQITDMELGGSKRTLKD